MNESTILPVECLLGAWVRQSSGTGTGCRRRAENARTRCPALSFRGTLVPAVDLRPQLDCQSLTVAFRCGQFAFVYSRTMTIDLEPIYSFTAMTILVCTFKVWIILGLVIPCPVRIASHQVSLYLAYNVKILEHLQVHIAMRTRAWYQGASSHSRVLRYLPAPLPF